MSDKIKKSSSPRGPKTIFHVFCGQLGPSEHDTIRWPEKVIALLDDEVKLLLGWMALKPENRARAVKLIPIKLRANLSELAVSQNPPDSTDAGF